MARFFFALDLPKETKQALQTVQLACEPALPKPTKLTNLHLTLIFLGNVEPKKLYNLSAYANQLRQEITSTVPIIINHADVFKKPKVVFAGLHQVPQWLNTCHQRLLRKATGLGINVENQHFYPHITLSRKVIELPEYQRFDIKSAIESFSLYRSDSTPNGVHYTRVQLFKFNNTNQM
ncbi:RNA 2',3'-cyclic phosphodiesterase [Thalassotalea euphylliae]|uniref:RNA 2',3'-cyclic phosphodiesterase n=1 Tax=Thalassotalea euphylliae TaxID=1655234 RepID=UPI003634B5F1